MQAATGELNLTLVTVIAIGLLLALFTGFMWPSIKERLEKGWKSTNANKNQLDMSYDFTDYIESELF